MLAPSSASSPSHARFMKVVFAPVLAFILASISLPSVQATAPVAEFALGPDMTVARMGHCIAALPDGRVVVFGGHGANFVSLASVEIWDPATNQFTAFPMNSPRDSMSLARLSDGRYLIAGGSSDLGVPAYASSELFDPTSGSFVLSGDMNRFRANAGAATLSDGSVLLEGGWWVHNDAHTYGELYEPTTGLFSPVDALLNPRASPLILPTNDGDAVVFGGYGPQGTPSFIEPIESFSHSNRTFSILQNALFADDSGWSGGALDRYVRPLESQKLSNGKYLLLADKSGADYRLFTYDPATNHFEAFPTTPAIAVASGAGIWPPLVDAERGKAYLLRLSPNPETLDLLVVDLKTGALETASGSYALPADSHVGSVAMTLLKDGRIFLTGGHSKTGADTNFSPIARTLFVKVSLPVATNLKIGDINGDGKINVSDATIALRIAVRLIAPTADQSLAGDVNGDGKVNVSDATVILRYAVGLIPTDQFPPTASGGTTTGTTGTGGATTGTVSLPPGWSGDAAGPSLVTTAQTDFAAGDAIAQGVIGSSGGRLDVAGKISVVLPAGSLSANETITIRKAQTESSLGEVYFIERDGGDGLLDPPAHILLPLASGESSGDFYPVQGVDSDVMTIPTYRYDEASRSLDITAAHFSLYAKLKKWAIGSTTVAVGTLILLLPVPGVNLTVGTTLIAVGVIGTLGVPAGEIINPVYQKWGLNHSITADGFTIVWTDTGDEAIVDPTSYTTYYDRERKSIEAWVKSGSPAAQAPADSSKDLLAVPRGIFQLICDLKESRAYYKAAGYDPYETMTVIVHRNIQGTGGTADGLWDEDYLHVNSDLLAIAKEKNRKATVAHETWHATTYKNGYKSGFKTIDPWQEDAICVAFEAEVFPGIDSGENYLWKDIGSTLRYGFLTPGPKEDPTGRGYWLWPWGRYLIRHYGHSELRDLLHGNWTNDILQTRFLEFARSLYRSDTAFASELPQNPSMDYSMTDPTHPPSITTGWGNLTLDSLRDESIELLPGVNAQAPSTAPLSFALYRARIPVVDPPAGGKLPPLVIRRSSPDASEQILSLKPHAIFNDLRSKDETESQKNGTVFRSDWRTPPTAGAKELLIPVVLVNSATSGDPAPASPIYVYSLTPPTDVSAKASMTSPGSIEISYKRPILDSSVETREFVKGYAIFIKKTTDPNEKPTKLDLSIVETNAPDTTPALIPKEFVPADAAMIGLASQDKMMSDPDAGGPLLSDISWASLGLQIDPSTAYLYPDETATFAAKTALGGTPQINWSVEGGTGSVSGGVFSPSGVAGTYKVTASLAADPTQKAIGTAYAFQRISLDEAQKAAIESVKQDGATYQVDIYPVHLEPGRCSMIAQYKGTVTISYTVSGVEYHDVEPGSVGRFEPTGQIYAIFSQSAACLSESW